MRVGNTSDANIAAAARTYEHQRRNHCCAFIYVRRLARAAAQSFLLLYVLLVGRPEARESTSGAIVRIVLGTVCSGDGARRKSANGAVIVAPGGCLRSVGAPRGIASAVGAITHVCCWLRAERRGCRDVPLVAGPAHPKAGRQRSQSGLLPAASSP